jgi:hypothetical protein
MDLCYAKEHVDTFVICSGDSDFSPLVSKLRENNKRVIGVGMKNSSSNLLIGNCDEFIFYDDIYRLNQAQPAMTATNVPLGKREMFDFLVSTVQSLLQERGDVLYSSLIKDTMTRKQPHFSERALGYATFGDVLEEARNLGLLEVERDARSGGTWVVHGLAAGAPAAAVAAAGSPAALVAPTADKPAGGRSSRRRRRSGRGGNGTRAPGEAAAGGAEAPEPSGTPATPAPRHSQADKPAVPATATPAVSTTGGTEGATPTAGKVSASRKTTRKPAPRTEPKPAPKPASKPAPKAAPAGKATPGKAPAAKAPVAAGKAPRAKAVPGPAKKAAPATGGRGTTKKAAMRPRAARRVAG